MVYINTVCRATLPNRMLPPSHLRKLRIPKQTKDEESAEQKQTKLILQHVETELAEFLSYHEIVEDFSENVQELFRTITQDFFVYRAMMLDPEHTGQEKKPFRVKLTARILNAIEDGKSAMSKLCEGKKPQN